MSATEKPGEYPYTRGIKPDAGVWTMGQYGVLAHRAKQTSVLKCYQRKA